MSKQTISDSKRKIEISLLEYNLLREVYRQLKKQALTLRILEAEKNLEKKKVKEIDVDKFVRNI